MLFAPILMRKILTLFSSSQNNPTWLHAVPSVVYGVTGAASAGGASGGAGGIIGSSVGTSAGASPRSVDVSIIAGGAEGTSGIAVGGSQASCTAVAVAATASFSEMERLLT